MKKNYLIFLFVPILSFSQLKKRNLIKSNPSTLIYKGVSLDYERVLNEKFTVGANFSYRPGSILKLPSFGQQFLKFYIRKVYKINPENSDFSKLSVGNMIMMPELKYFFAKKTPKGAYSSFLFKMKELNSTFPTKFSINLRGYDVSFIYPIYFKNQSYAFGFKLGYQAKINRSFFLDTFVNFGYDFIVKINSDTQETLSFLTLNEQQLIGQKVYEIYHLPERIFNVQVSGTGIKIIQTKNLKGISLPSFGINLGYSF